MIFIIEFPIHKTMVVEQNTITAFCRQLSNHIIDLLRCTRSVYFNTKWMIYCCINTWDNSSPFRNYKNKQTRHKYVVKGNTCIPWQSISACVILSRKDKISRQCISGSFKNLKWAHLLCQKHLQCFFEQLCKCNKKILQVFYEKTGYWKRYVCCRHHWPYSISVTEGSLPDKYVPPMGTSVAHINVWELVTTNINLRLTQNLAWPRRQVYLVVCHEHHLLPLI